MPDTSSVAHAVFDLGEATREFTTAVKGLQRRQRWVIALLVAVLLVVVSVVYFAVPRVRTEKKYIVSYREHPQGLVHLPAFDSEQPITPKLTLVCEAYGTKGLNPQTSVPEAGQRLVSDCEMTQAGQVG